MKPLRRFSNLELLRGTGTLELRGGIIPVDLEVSQARTVESVWLPVQLLSRECSVELLKEAKVETLTDD